MSDLYDMAVEIHNTTELDAAIPKEAFATIVAAYVDDIHICPSCDRAGRQHAGSCDLEPHWTEQP